MYSIQRRSVESWRQEDEGEEEEIITRAATGEGMCMTEQEAIVMEEIDSEEEGRGDSNEEGTEEHYFEDPTNAGNHMQQYYNICDL